MVDVKHSPSPTPPNVGSPDEPDPRPLALFVRLAGRPVLVVGAGPVAARKIATLVGVGAQVTVVAPTAVWSDPPPGVRWIRRAFEPDDLRSDPYALVVAATGDLAVDQSVAELAEADGRWVSVASAASLGNTWFAPTVRRGSVSIAISTGGDLPALSRLLFELVEAILPSDGWLSHARELRRRWKLEGTATTDRFSELVASIATKAGGARGRTG